MGTKSGRKRPPAKTRPSQRPAPTASSAPRMPATAGPSDRAIALGGWLSGPGTLPDGSVPGDRRLDLPEDGPNSVARIGRRLGGILLDLVAASLISHGLLLAFPHATLTEVTSVQTATYVLLVWLFQAATGQTIGQRFTRTRIVSIDGTRPRVWWLLLRVTLMVATLFLVGLVVDADGRGLQDKAAGTVVLTL